MIMQDERLVYENLERRKSNMLRMLSSRLSGVVLIIFLVGSFLAITGQANAGLQAPVVVEADTEVAGFWDLRNRQSFFQVTNVSGGAIVVHVQVWNASEEGFSDRCREFDFFDSYTGNDTHVYDLSNLQTNDGTVINPPPLDDGHGYIYVSVDTGGCDDDTNFLIANHRIIDVDGRYEYRSAALGLDFGDVNTDTFGFNFNSENDTTFSDIVPIIVEEDFGSGVCRHEPRASNVLVNTVTVGENRQSCAPLVIGCKPTTQTGQDQAALPNPVLVDLGINNALVNSRGYPSLCTDTTPDGWMILEYTNQFLNGGYGCGPNSHTKSCGGLVGINNDDGTGSMESWTALDRELDYFDLD
jgi:hypothetical protein